MQKLETTQLVIFYKCALKKIFIDCFCFAFGGSPAQDKVQGGPGQAPRHKSNIKWSLRRGFLMTLRAARDCIFMSCNDDILLFGAFRLCFGHRMENIFGNLGMLLVYVLMMFQTLLDMCDGVFGNSSICVEYAFRHCLDVGWRICCLLFHACVWYMSLLFAPMS